MGQILILQILLSSNMAFYRVEVSTRSSWRISKHSVIKQKEGLERKRPGGKEVAEVLAM